MVMRPRYINMLLVILAIIAPTGAYAQPAPLDFTGTYDFTVANIPFGSADIAFSQNASSYKASSDIRTSGIVRVFVQHDSHTTASGAGKDFHYSNSTYESDYQTRKKKKYVKMVMKDGALVEEITTPPDDRSVRPAVDAALKDSAYNPLAFGLAMRRELAECMQVKCESFVLNYFDGRRLTQGVFTPQGNRVLRTNSRKYATYVVTAKRRPIAGFTEKELRDIHPNEAALTIYFSADERLVPLKLEFPMALGVAAATLRQ